MHGWMLTFRGCIFMQGGPGSFCSQQLAGLINVQGAEGQVDWPILLVRRNR
jgi:hypothetical protein